MPSRSGRRWDDPWVTYPPSTPLKVEDGIATSKQRGEMASTWWSQRFVQLLATYGLGGRMERGRRYARKGQLVSFDVQPGVILAQVQGSRATPYVASVLSQPLTDAQWSQVLDAMRRRVAFVARLLGGEVPPELEAVFDEVGVPLLPRRWRDVRASCSCPDWENPCKHLAAVLYVFADRLDDDPWLLLRWRGREREEVLAHLRGGAGGAGAAGAGDEVAPWWPLVPGARLPAAARGDALADPLAGAPDEPAAVLRRLEPLAVDVRGAPATDAVAAAYRAIVAADG